MLRKINPIEAFELNILILKIVGAWSFADELLYKIYKNCAICLTFSFYLSTLTATVVGYDSKMAEDLYTLPPMFESSMKLVMFRKNFQKILATLEILQTTHFQPRNNNQSELLRRAVSFSKFCLKTYLYLTVVSGGALLLFPLIKGGYQLFVIVWFPFDYQQPLVFQIVYIYISICGTFCALTNVAVDSFLYISWIQLGAQFDCISNSFQCLTAGEDGRKILIDSIQRYHVVLNHVKLFSEAYKEIIMIQFVTSIGAICITMYQMSLEQGLSAKFVQLLLFQMILTFEIFCCCYLGEQITEKSETVFRATYESDWCDRSRNFKKDLLIFMGQTKKPVVFYAWGIFPVNLTTFKQIMQKSWSFFVALKNTHDISHQ